MMRTLRLGISISALVAAVGCSGSTPTGPGASSSSSTLPGASASASSAGSTSMFGTATVGKLDDHPGERDVDGDGAVSSLVSGTACPALAFIVQGHTVRTSATTMFPNGRCADIAVGARLQVQGKMQSDGSINAARIELKGSDDNNGRFVEGDAVVTSVVAGTSCPALSFKVDGHLIKTTAATKFDAGACTDIVVGRPLTVKGMLQSDGSVIASHVVLKGDHPTFVDGEAVIASLVSGTSCPTVSFVVEGHTVKTTATTVFQNGTCTDVKAAARVQIKGLMTTPDGTVVASEIRFKTADGGDGLR